MALLTGSCTETVTRRESIPFSRGPLQLTVTSVGTALDGEKYELTFQDGGKRQTFFTGWNFGEFHAAEKNGRMMIQICKGWIDHAEPIARHQGEGIELTRLDIDWTCANQPNVG